MNLNTLHHYLTTLSPSELRYRAGERYTGWENMPKVFVQDKEYSLLNITDTDSLVYQHPAVLQNPGIHAELPEISIKKNSRFNPVPEHIHPYIEINYVYSGQCPQIFDRKTCDTYEKSGAPDRHKLSAFNRSTRRRRYYDQYHCKN